MPRDISEILKEWAYDPEDNIRIVEIGDGRQVMQVRQPLGIEQYELEGRPDGMRPFGESTILDWLSGKLSKYFLKNGEDKGFSITKDEFMLLQNEGILFYYRYLHLFQISDYERTARDTEHNLRLCDFVEKYTGKDADPMAVLQYKPYILRMNAVSKAMMSLHKNLKKIAAGILEGAIDQIEHMPEMDSPAFKFEKIRSIQYLRSTLKQVYENKSDPVDELKKELEEAIAEEEYELAAELRDRIEELTKIRDGGP